MSCPDANAPIDINLQNIAGKCNLKCAYNYNYPISTCNVTNRGSYISIRYDTFPNPPITYNTVPYNVQEIRIYNPSLHSFAGNKSVGEIIIIHNSNKGGNPLLVCVPLEEDNSNTTGSSFLTDIIETMSTSAPSDGESTNVSIDNFTLNDFVSKTPFFSYTAIQPYQPCVGNVYIIVFGKASGSCKISTNTLQKFKSIITENTYTVKKGPLLFYNSDGPGSSQNEDEIFIDCQPVNTSAEETTMTTETTSSSGSMEPIDIMNTPSFQIIIVCLLTILLIFGVKYVFGYFQDINFNKINATIVKGLNGNG
jgi:carbonic anhydrase